MTTARGNGHATAAYSERLAAPLWWYPVALLVAAIIAAEFRVASIALTVWIPFGVLLPLAVIVVWWVGRSRVEVRGGELHIRGAHLPLGYVSGAVALDARTLRRVIGREGDPAAYVATRPWIGSGVQLWLDDDEDPTPYWVVSSRRPDELVSVVRGDR